MDTQEMDQQSKRMLAIIEQSNAADEAYRRCRAQKTINLLTPQNGEKKPTEAMMNAILDTDPELCQLRDARNKANAMLTVSKLAFESWSRDVPANGPGPLLG